jgi:transketolase
VASPCVRELANALRILAMDAVEQAKSGHPGMPLGMADVATVLWTQFLRFSPQHPEWPNRDRFILSAGHGSLLLYALLHVTGYPSLTLDQLKAFRQLHSLTPGHPEFRHTPGVEVTTGPLAQGLAHGVGIAMGEALVSARVKDPSLLSHYTYVVVGDGCLMEGLSQEAISLAGHLKLSHLIVLFDDNHMTIDGPTHLSTSEVIPLRFEACGWHVQSIDGHDPEAIAQAIRAAQEAPLPSLIACRTHIAYGAPHKQDTAAAHGSPLGAAEVAATRAALGWPSSTAFDIPSQIQEAWRDVGLKGDQAYQTWLQHYEQLDESTRKRAQTYFCPAQNVEGVRPAWKDTLDNLIEAWVAQKPALATRQSSQLVLDALAPHLPNLIGGSADLTPSNNTLAAGMQMVTPGQFEGAYVHYGIREHAMVAAVNGLTLYGGLIPYGGTFLAFSDYARPAIRLAALMKIPSIYVMTHDSIGLGEDGPTHQPVEHLMALRAMPNLNVFRPADGVEVAECWELAMTSHETPSLLALSRQALPTVRTQKGFLSAKGAYILREATLPHEITLFATGSEVQIACRVAEKLEQEEKCGARVVSMPCWRLFEQQPLAYKANVLTLPPNGLAAAIEAGSTLGWERYVGREGLIFGLETFGASAPAADLFSFFGLTAEAIFPEIQKRRQALLTPQK